MTRILNILLFFSISIISCNNQPEYFSGQLEYKYTYESEFLNVDSLSKLKPYKSIFRYDKFNYQSQFIGTDTLIYYYSGKLNKCVSQTNNDSNFECEDYGIATDSVFLFKIYDTDETVLGYRCKIIEWKGKYFFNKFYVATKLKISPYTYKTHLAYNWKFYGEQSNGGLILKSEHRFKNYTMKGIATAMQINDPKYIALEINENIFSEYCKKE